MPVDEPHMSLARVQNRSSGHGELCLRQVPDSFPRNRLTVSTSVTRERGGNQKVPLSGVPVQTGRCQRRGPRPRLTSLPRHPVRDVPSSFLACTADCKQCLDRAPSGKVIDTEERLGNLENNPDCKRILKTRLSFCQVKVAFSRTFLRSLWKNPLTNIPKTLR